MDIYKGQIITYLQCTGWKCGKEVWCKNGLLCHFCTPFPLQVGYEDDGKLRPVLHRMSLVEMAVPYGDPNYIQARKSAFDVGDYVSPGGHGISEVRQCI